MKVDIVKLLSTFFGIGYLPYCPGTWASLVGLGIYFLLRNYFIIYIFLAAITLITGFLISGRAEDRFKKIDSSFIVIDEIAAMLVLLIFVPRSLFLLIIAFVIFRLADIVKPYPIKKIEKFPGSWGIMGDDLLAGVYTVGFIWIINILFLGGRSG
ncbi:MAG: phosphatidylglycerophosphatase A [Candidatus Omnitrophota bacterium]